MSDTILQSTTIDATINENQNVISATIDETQNVVEATVGNITEITAELGTTLNYTLANSGSGAQVYNSLSATLKLFRTLISSDGSLLITQDTNDIDIVIQDITTQVQIFELKNLLKTGQINYYTEYIWLDDNPINIDKWTDSGKTTKLFSKTLTWLSGNCTQTVTVDETTSATLTVDYTYDGNDNVITSTEVLT